MNETTTTQNPSEHPKYLEDISTPADYTLGVILIFCTSIGIPGNLISVLYFYTQPARSGTALFFNKLYTVIAGNDLIICVSVIPAIEASMRSYRESKIFINEVFCNVWSILWGSISSTSVFFVAVISIARLYVLMRPTKQLKGILGTVIPFIYLIFTLTLEILLTFGGIEEHYYFDDCLACLPLGKDKVKEALVQFLKIIQLGVPIIPIFVSCILSIIWLKKLKNKSERMNSSTARQNEATVTVIIFTVIYIIFNIPVVINYIYLMCWVVHSSQFDTIDESDKSYEEYYNTPFLSVYSWPITYIVCVAVNSCVNPIVYYYRMRPFKRFVCNRFQHQLEVRRSTVTTPPTYQLERMATVTTPRIELVAIVTN